MVATLKFDLTLKEVPVELGDKKYTLRELDGESRVTYLDSFDVNVTLIDGKPQIQGGALKGFTSIKFLTMCLFDSDGKAISEDFLNRLPGRVVEKLHKEALKLSGLGNITKEEETEAKNE